MGFLSKKALIILASVLILHIVLLTAFLLAFLDYKKGQSTEAELVDENLKHFDLDL